MTQKQTLIPSSVRTPWLWATLLAILTVAILFGRPGAGNGNSITLTATDRGGKMLVDWDPHNRTVQSAEGGMLDVLDGGELSHYRVDTSVLQSGRLEYLRKSDDVLLKLIVYRDGRPELQPMVRSVGYRAPEAAETRQAHVPAKGTRARRR